MVVHSSSVFEPTPASADACGEVTGCNVSCQEVSRCGTRGGSPGMYIAFASAKANKAESALALKHRGDVTRNPKQGYQRPQNRTRVCVRHKHLKKVYGISSFFSRSQPYSQMLL